jgi:hypothetical protein
MQLLFPALKAQMHEETYRSMLRGALQRGDRAEIARRAQVSVGYLNYVVGPGRQRTLSLRMAQKIAGELPWDAAQRDSFLEHVMSSKESGHHLSRMAAQVPLPLLLAEVQAMHGAANIGSHEGHRSVYAIGARIIHQFRPDTDPLSFTKMCLILSSTCNNINRPGDALYYAKLAYNVMASTPLHRKEEEALYLEAIQAQAVAFHNLKLEKEAYEQLKEVNVKRGEFFGIVQVNAIPILTLCETPRFALYEVEEQARRIRDACYMMAREDANQAAIFDFSIETAVGRAYLRYGNLKKAKTMFSTLYDRFQNMQGLDLLRQVIYLGDYAQVLSCTRDLDEAGYVAQRAISIARDAGLTHQIHKLHGMLGELLLAGEEE